MKVETVKELVERQPFSPFSIRLSNGAQYTFNNSKDVGAPKDYHLIVYFSENQAVMIDTDNIVEVFGK
ncbi:MAG: hypothetical protein ABIR24_11645 [Verrucomicrobiota bacterium]